MGLRSGDASDGPTEDGVAPGTLVTSGGHYFSILVASSTGSYVAAVHQSRRPEVTPHASSQAPLRPIEWPTRAHCGRTTCRLTWDNLIAPSSRPGIVSGGSAGTPADKMSYTRVWRGIGDRRTNGDIDRSREATDGRRGYRESDANEESADADVVALWTTAETWEELMRDTEYRLMKRPCCRSRNMSRVPLLKS